MQGQFSQLLKAYLISLSALFLLFFVAAVREAIRRRERASNLMSAVGFGAGVLGAGLTLAGGGLQIPLLARADRGIEPVIAQATNDLSLALFISSWLALAVFLGSTAAAAITSRALPRWVGLGALIAAAGLVVIALAPRQPWIYDVYGLFPVWVVVASVVLIRSPASGTGP